MRHGRRVGGRSGRHADANRVSPARKLQSPTRRPHERPPAQQKQRPVHRGAPHRFRRRREEWRRHGFWKRQRWPQARAEEPAHPADRARWRARHGAVPRHRADDQDGRPVRAARLRGGRHRRVFHHAPARRDGRRRARRRLVQLFRRQIRRPLHRFPVRLELLGAVHPRQHGRAVGRRNLRAVLVARRADLGVGAGVLRRDQPAEPGEREVVRRDGILVLDHQGRRDRRDDRLRRLAARERASGGPKRASRTCGGTAVSSRTAYRGS